MLFIVDSVLESSIRFFHGWIIILSALILLIITYICKSKRGVWLSKKRGKGTDRDLEKENRELIRLSQKLQESNLIKEKYIVYFMNLCSEYVYHLEDYQKTVVNKVAANRIDELRRITSSYSEKTGIQKELFAHFDQAFLELYPDFVSSINTLLKKESRFVVKNGELNTELRIFALIRLGTTDSEKIASFLHCSIQTVRNYRSKIKHNCMDGSSEGIEEWVKKIGDIH